MRNQRFQEILQEVRRVRWADVLSLALKNFDKEHPGEKAEAFFSCRFYCNWSYDIPKKMMGPEEVIPCLETLSEEAVFCLNSIEITPTLVFRSGNERKDMPAFNFTGNEAPRWQQLRLCIDGEETLVKRNEVVAGAAVADAPAGQLAVFVADSCSVMLISADGAFSPSLCENKEFYQKCFPGVQAMLEYDHEEFPALWSWLHIDEETDGKDTPSYNRHKTEKDDLSEGMVYIDASDYDDELPVVSVIEIRDRSLTLHLKADNLDKTIVLDKPNHRQIIWRKGKRSLRAMLYVEEPRTAKASQYYGVQDAPAGCRALLTVSHNGEDTSFMIQVRSLDCNLRPSERKSPYWEYPCAWGFENGKMVLGSDSLSSRRTFIGLVPEGEQFSCKINDRNSFWEYGDPFEEADLNLVWENVEIGFEVEDGVLKSVPDQKEIVVPVEALMIDAMALLSAPSLEKITIHAGMTGFSYALETYHQKRHRKLDVVFEGGLQDWFDHASVLSNHIGKLFIGGSEQDLYSLRHFVSPAGISRIGYGLFQNNDSIESVVLGPEVISIGRDAFRGCRNLRSVKVMGPAVIGDDAFSSCKTIEEVYLADGVSELGEGVFDYITTLDSVFIPASVLKAGRLSSQNDGSYRRPKFLCAAPAKPEGWYKEWNLSYFDRRFGFGCGHDHYHPVRWGCERVD
jgi:hypothetical protein